MKTKIFQGRLRHFRAASGLSFEELAAKAGVHPQTVRKLEDGQRSWPRLDIAKKLAGALGVTIDQLAG